MFVSIKNIVFKKELDLCLRVDGGGSSLLRVGFLELLRAVASLCLWCACSSLWWFLIAEHGL